MVQIPDKSDDQKAGDTAKEKKKTQGRVKKKVSTPEYSHMIGFFYAFF